MRLIPPLDWMQIKTITTAGIYTTGTWAAVIRQLKFHQLVDIAQPAGQLLAHALRQALEPEITSSSVVFVPVPLHPQRQRERGYNQAALIANVLGLLLSGSVEPKLMIRRRNTLPQAGRTAAVRQTNITDAFELVLQHSATMTDWSQVSIVIVDDVITTGATVAAVAAALQPLQPAAIHAAALVRGG